MKKYDNYKDSGVEWIGEIPEHWETIKFNLCVKIRHGHQFMNYDFTEDGVKIVKITQLHKNGYLDLSNCSFVKTERVKEFNSILIKEKDILMCLTGGTIGKIIRVGSVNEPLLQNYRVGHFSSAIDNKICDDFIFWVMSSEYLVSQIFFQMRETGQPNIGMDDFGRMKITIPPIKEQTAIANYLDHKTTQLDTLITKKQQFITLLQEERIAVINQAVTKGLDPKVKMKGSGIEWLGEIPEHWEVKQVRYLLEEGKEGIKIGPFGSSLKLDFMIDKGYKVYGQENVIKNDFTKGTKYIDESKYKEMVNYTISSGDIVITMMGTAGLAKVVPIDFEPGIMDSHLTRIRVNKSKFSNRLFELLINDSYLIKSQVQFHSKGSIMGGLNSSIIKSFILPTPDVDEQVKILAFIEKSILYNQEIMNKTKQEIELLKEYKTALISEVVTGKVDVRDVVLN